MNPTNNDQTVPAAAIAAIAAPEAAPETSPFEEASTRLAEELASVKADHAALLAELRAALDTNPEPLGPIGTVLPNGATVTGYSDPDSIIGAGAVHLKIDLTPKPTAFATSKKTLGHSSSAITGCVKPVTSLVGGFCAFAVAVVGGMWFAKSHPDSVATFAGQFANLAHSGSRQLPELPIA